MKFLGVLGILILISAVYSFSIDSYYTHAEVLTNGDLKVYENINFTLERAYNEGFRDIRKEDYEVLVNLIIESVKVNGQNVAYEKQLNGDNAEIVWKKTFAGKNNVELVYTLKNRAQMYDDFAKICFEHFGAGWGTYATSFHSEMQLPEASRGKEMHFEIYSNKKGQAQIDDLTVLVDIENVPPGNYVGGCYLYDKSALNTTNRVNGSAYAILRDERKIYNSEIIIPPESSEPLSFLFCLPLAIVVGLVGVYVYKNEKKIPKYPESILPPDNEEPEVVSSLVRYYVENEDIMAATILGLINKNVLEIVELEEKGETSAEVKRKRTILILKKRPAGLKEKENILLDMFFDQKTEVDLDKLADEFDKISTKEDAQKINLNVEKFDSAVAKVLSEKGVGSHNPSAYIKWIVLLMGIVGIPFVLCPLSTFAAIMLAIYSNEGNFIEIGAFAVSALILVGVIGYFATLLLKPSIPKGKEEEYAKWDGFARAVKASRLKEYPPESVLIWGEILVYATAIGLAEKVKEHFSELDKFIVDKMDKMSSVRKSSVHFYTSAIALNNLRKYGTREHGKGGRHGGFSSRSSGGWSHGGGGFGRSSGGGGFR